MARNRKNESPADLEVDDDSGPSPVDVHVGSRLRLRRTLLGLSQAALGDRVGLTFQQIQKYERGANRVSASRLWEFSNVLDVPVSFFFDDMPGDAGLGMPAGGLAADGHDAEVMHRQETMELVRAYYGVRDPLVRKRLYDIFKALGASVGNKERDAAPPEQGI
jgi:transcriptional regulator with XRE-family HTH domain